MIRNSTNTFRLKSSLFTLCEYALDQKLDKYQIEWDSRCALGTVIATQGYPQSLINGQRIGHLPSNKPNMHIFHAGTIQKDDHLLQMAAEYCVLQLFQKTYLWPAIKLWKLLMPLTFQAHSLEMILAYQRNNL